MGSLHVSKLLIFDVATWLRKDYKLFTSAYILKSKTIGYFKESSLIDDLMTISNELFMWYKTKQQNH